MQPSLTFAVEGGYPRTAPRHLIRALQTTVEAFGAEGYPLFLRLGGHGQARLMPVTARALLAESERFAGVLESVTTPGIGFLDLAGTELGRVYARADGRTLARSGHLLLSVTDQGLRLVTTEFPPPAGFRSGKNCASGEYECFFVSFQATESGWTGRRTSAMRGSGAPVLLAALPVPNVTHWDQSRVAGRPEVARLEFLETPAPEAFRDVIHALQSACMDSIRLKQPLYIASE